MYIIETWGWGNIIFSLRDICTFIRFASIVTKLVILLNDVIQRQ